MHAHMCTETDNLKHKASSPQLGIGMEITDSVQIYTKHI